MSLKIRLFDKFFSAFPALRHKNYQLYFSGQLISSIGTWLQMVAQGWLVLELTHSAFLVGLVSAIGSLPVLFFSLFGGVIVDRFPKKKILVFTQTVAMVLAFILGVLTIFHIINLLEIFTLAFLLGLVTALDNPARQTFVVEMVGRKDLASAIALNSGIFNGARVIGPGVAGITIALFGSGGAFILNAISYIAVIIALFYIKLNIELPQVHPHPLKAIKEGIYYSFTHPVIKTLLIFTALSSIFGWAYSTIMPVIIQNVFHKGADSLGYFYSAIGIGAICGIFVVSAFSKKISNMTFILGGNFLFIISLLFFTFVSSFYLAFPLLFLAGFGLIMQFSMINSTIQHVVPNYIRGRVMSIYMLMFMGMMPIGSFQIGFIAEHFGSSFAIRLGLIILLMTSIILYTNRKKIQLEYEKSLIEEQF